MKNTIYEYHNYGCLVFPSPPLLPICGCKCSPRQSVLRHLQSVLPPEDVRSSCITMQGKGNVIMLYVQRSGGL
jgi:hypothetical protein